VKKVPQDVSYVSTTVERVVKEKSQEAAAATKKEKRSATPTRKLPKVLSQGQPNSPNNVRARSSSRSRNEKNDSVRNCPKSQNDHNGNVPSSSKPEKDDISPVEIDQDYINVAHAKQPRNRQVYKLWIWIAMILLVTNLTQTMHYVNYVDETRVA
jgi:hypothetical protein